MIASPWPKWLKTLLVFNLLFAAWSALGGPIAVGLMFSGSDDPHAWYPVALFAVRTVVVGATVIVFVIRAWQSQAAGPLPLVLLIAGLIQVGDVVIGVLDNNPALYVGAAVFAAVHLFTASRLA